MSVRTLDELLTDFRGLGIDETKPEFVKMLEDMSDSYTGSAAIDEARNRVTELEDLLKKSEQRYIDRFFGTQPENRKMESKATEEKEENTEEVDTFSTDEEAAQDFKEER